MKRIFNYIFYELRIKHKLLLVFLAAAVLPFVVFLFMADKRVKEALYSNVLYSANQSYDQAYTFLSYKLYSIQKSTNALAINEKVIEILSTPEEDYQISKQLEDMRYLRGALHSLEDKENIIKMRLYVREGFVYSNEGMNIFNIETLKDKKWFQDVSRLKIGNFYFQSDSLEDHNVMAVSKSIFNENNYSSMAGIVRSDFNKSSILEILTKANTISDSLTFIFNENKEVVAYSNHIFYRHYVGGELGIVPFETRDFTKIQLNQTVFLMKSMHIPQSNWYMATCIPARSLTDAANPQFNYLGFGLLVSILASFLFIKGVSFTLTRRISQLMKNMQKVKSNDIKTIAYSDYDSNDEIGMLIKDYNAMLLRIENLMEEKYEAGMQLRASELEMLQSLINPHFLYNTLETINWMALKQRSSDIITVTTSLSKLYRISLNKGNYMITIEDEIQHACYYFKIQNMRFDNKINLILTADETPKTYKIPKIILQPIIENSIIHGILEKENPSGTIQLEVKGEDNFFLLSVMDDGVGIQPNELAVLQQKDFDHSGSYGLKNIYLRLKGLSDENDIFFDSNHAQTKVTLKIKKNL